MKTKVFLGVLALTACLVGQPIVYASESEILDSEGADASPARVIRLRVEGELGLPLRIALSRVFDPNAASSFLNPDDVRVQSVSELGVRCRSEVGADLAPVVNCEGLSFGRDQKRAELTSVELESPWWNWRPWGVESKHFVILGKDSELLQGYPQLSSENVVGVPLAQDWLHNQREANGIKQVVSANASNMVSGNIMFNDLLPPELVEIDRDLKSYDVTTRQFNIPENVDPSLIDAVVRTANSTGTASVELLPQLADEITLPRSAVVFQADSEDCFLDHPEDAGSISELQAVLEHNLSQLDKLSIFQFARASALIVDTGVGKELLESESIRRFVDLNVSEALRPDYYFNGLTYSVSNRVCLGADRLAKSFAFGYTPNIPKSECKEQSAVERIAPLSDSGTNIEYTPGHGSFVALLAMGGASLYKQFPQLSRLIGLQFARITRFANSEESIVRTTVADLKGAIDYAVKAEVEIVNLSIKVEDRDYLAELVEALENYEGLVVAAAGNLGTVARPENEIFPAQLSSEIVGKMLIVGAVSRAGDGYTWWPRSVRSPTHVHIAALGDRVRSMDHRANMVCMSGTSASAPSVTFVAGLLSSFGVKKPAEIRARILNTADIYPELSQEVELGRVLNSTAALDLFVDQIWLHGERRPRRGVLTRLDGAKDKPVMLQLCEEEDRFYRGFLHASMLRSWSRNDSQATIQHGLGLGLEQIGCTVPDVEIGFITDDAVGGIERLSLRQVERIVPGPFSRSGFL